MTNPTHEALADERDKLARIILEACRTKPGVARAHPSYEQAAHIADTILTALRNPYRKGMLRAADIAEKWESSLRPGTEARLLGHQEAARNIAAAIRKEAGE